jgi:isoleucyl-tRNA synthetase
LLHFARAGFAAFHGRLRASLPALLALPQSCYLRATPQWFISLDAVSAAAASNEVETDEDGRYRSNYTENEPDAPPRSLREGALAEIERVKWIPSWGRDRMRNMLHGRPDWCISRQRVWACRFLFSIAPPATKRLPSLSLYVALPTSSSMRRWTWYTREARELLPENFKRPKCGGAEFTKEMDILDVWFDSGVSSLDVLEKREGLRWPADLYLEGGDQYRGWFNSSLMLGLAAHDRAPYQTVLTHGWAVDGQGKAMHKSAGNAVSPNEVIKESGAEILRLWCASTDYHEDMRLSPEILQRVSDAYRKMRNTARLRSAICTALIRRAMRL